MQGNTPLLGSLSGTHFYACMTMRLMIIIGLIMAMVMVMMMVMITIIG